jgi:hypothetical protein
MIMKPIIDIFNSHIQGLYKGHEVDAPGSVQEGLFHQLDAINGSTVNGSASGGFTSKAVLGAAVVIVAFAWYLMPVSVDQVVVAEVDSVEEHVVEEVEDVEEISVIESLHKVKVAPEAIEATVEIRVEEPILEEEVIENTVVAPVVEDVHPEVVVDVVIPIVDPIVDNEIFEEAAPAEGVIKIKEVKEVLEWVLPAKLEVDE